MCRRHSSSGLVVKWVVNLSPKALPGGWNQLYWSDYGMWTCKWVASCIASASKESRQTHQKLRQLVGCLGFSMDFWGPQIPYRYHTNTIKSVTEGFGIHSILGIINDSLFYRTDSSNNQSHEMGYCKSSFCGWKNIDCMNPNSKLWLFKRVSPPEIYNSPWKMGFGRLLPYWGPVTFQGRTVKKSLFFWRMAPVNSKYALIGKSPTFFWRYHIFGRTLLVIGMFYLGVEWVSKDANELITILAKEFGGRDEVFSYQKRSILR